MGSLALSAIEAILGAEFIDIDSRGEQRKSSGWLVVVDRSERHPISRAGVAVVCWVLCVEVARVARSYRIEIFTSATGRTTVVPTTIRRVAARCALSAEDARGVGRRTPRHGMRESGRRKIKKTGKTKRLTNKPF
jgi:hypothetical protein